MLFEKLPFEHLRLIDEYRYAYSGSETCYVTGPWADLSYVLRLWDAAKSDYLYQLLGKQFTISKEVSYQLKDDALIEEMDCMISGEMPVGSRKEHDGRLFCKEFKLITTQICYKNGYNNYWYDYMMALIAPRNLIKNNYYGPDFECPLPNGKTLRINKGCKPIKVLGKLAKAYGIPGYEDFRIAHSLIMNQSRLNGKLTLSIHPLDYMTMSDNHSGWDTCMSWVNEGSYRQGTIEMMNSKSVVVAYLESSVPYLLPHNRKWNNKKWRQLFVVDPKAIMGIKSYPYENDELSETCLNWLKDLAHENLGWDYQENIQYDPQDGIVLDGSETANFVEVETGYMYNDLGCADYHYLALGEGITAEDCSTEAEWSHALVLPYSGSSECIVCGNDNPDLMNDGSLACNDCCNYSYCDYCENETPADQLIEIDDMMICQDCYENQVESCQVCGDEHLTFKMSEIRVLPRLSQEYMRKMQKKWAERSWDRGDYYPVNYQDAEFNFSVRRAIGYTCPCCESLWRLAYLKDPETKIKEANIAWSNDRYVFLDELKEERSDELLMFRSRREGETMEQYNQSYITWLEIRYGIAYGYPMEKRDS